MSELIPPRVRAVPAALTSYGSSAVELSHSYGLTLDPWQAGAVVDLMGRNGDKWSAPRAAVSVPRQAGKNSILESVELFKMAVLGRRILHTAHEVKTAMKAFKRLLWFFDNPQYPELKALVSDIRKTNGQEAIWLTNGGSFELSARSKGAARGFSVDDLVCDEAQDLSEEAFSALLYTISASPLQPQTILTGTPPGAKSNGEVFARWRDQGIVGDDQGLCYLEWSAEEGCDLDDQTSWKAANPSTAGPRGLPPLEQIALERAAADDESFARERLGMWGTSASRRIISAERWSALANVDSMTVGPVAVAIAVSADEQAASIGLAGWSDDGRRHLEWVTPPVPDFDAGPLDWLVPTAIQINRVSQPRCFIIDRTSTAARFVDPLRAAGLTVIEVGVNEYANACGTLLAEAKSGALVHLDQPTLNFALSVATKRSTGTEGKWRWQRRGSEADITPLDAVTLAIHGLSDGLKLAKPRSNSASFF